VPLTARLIACFDVVGDRVTKARRFQDNIDVGDAARIAAQVYADGIDEVIFYDILASAERRQANLPVIEPVAAQVFVPLTVGGGPVREVTSSGLGNQPGRRVAGAMPGSGAAGDAGRDGRGRAQRGMA
jgi:imidazole glycerol phosphate synthase subunit HisF